MVAVLIVPGLHNSGPDHWQTWWQHQENAAERAEQEDWHAPELERWSARVGEAMDRAGEPVWLVAHSFGCLVSVHAAMQRPDRVAGALLVAPANPERFGIESALAKKPHPFPSILVASLDDPWMPFLTAVSWSSHWGSRLVNLGKAGHINAESGYGPWPAGRALLRELQDRKSRPALHPVRDISHAPHPG